MSNLRSDSVHLCLCGAQKGSWEDICYYISSDPENERCCYKRIWPTCCTSNLLCKLKSLYMTATELFKVTCWHCSFLDYWSASQNTFWEKCTQAIERYRRRPINERGTRSCHIWNTETLWSRLPWCLYACLRLYFMWM